MDAPANWMMNGEYGSEFGAFSPSRFVSRQPTNVSTWHMFAGRRLSALDAGSGEWWWKPFAVVQVQHIFTPAAISHTWRLPRHWMRRDTVLTTSSISDGRRRSGMSARSRALIPLSENNRPPCRRWLSQNNVVVRDHTFSMALCHRFLSLPEWQSPISLTDLRFFAPALTKEEFHATVSCGWLPWIN